MFRQLLLLLLLNCATGAHAAIGEPEIRAFFHEQVPQEFIERLIARANKSTPLNQIEAKQQLDPLLSKIEALLKQHESIKNEAEELRARYSRRPSQAYRDETVTLLAQKDVQIASLEARILDAAEEAAIIPFLAVNDIPAPFTFKEAHFVAKYFGIPSLFIASVETLLVSDALRTHGIFEITGAVAVGSGLAWATASFLKAVRDDLRSRKSYTALELAKTRLRALAAQHCTLALAGTGVRVAELKNAVAPKEEIPIEWEDPALEKRRAVP